MDPESFEAQRPRLTAIAARILGTPADADDVVQEVWLRASAADAATVEDPAAWLTTVTTRLCLDHLRRRGTRQRMEDRVRDEAETVTPGPEGDVLAAEQVSEAMGVVLGALRPTERAAFVLHDVLGYGFSDVGAILGRSDTAVRQLASRARRKVRGGDDLPPAVHVDPAPVVEAFLAAAHGQEISTLLTLLAPDAVMHVDAVAQAMGAEASYDGPDAVANRFRGARAARLAMIDGEPGVAWFAGKTARVAFVFHVDAGTVREIEMIADPEVLGTLEITRIKSRP